jgi:hypothetical protein
MSLAFAPLRPPRLIPLRLQRTTPPDTDRTPESPDRTKHDQKHCQNSQNADTIPDTIRTHISLIVEQNRILNLNSVRLTPSKKIPPKPGQIDTLLRHRNSPQNFSNGNPKPDIPSRKHENTKRDFPSTYLLSRFRAFVIQKTQTTCPQINPSHFHISSPPRLRGKKPSRPAPKLPHTAQISPICLMNCIPFG